VELGSVKNVLAVIAAQKFGYHPLQSGIDE
jgi:hypothetical protein